MNTANTVNTAASTRGMIVVGVTGRSGSGKSTVARHYAALGYPVADGDAISRQVCGPGSPCLAELTAAFGRNILAGNGTLLRHKLGELAYASPDANRRLVEITHRYILPEVEHRRARAQAGGAALFFLDGAIIVGGPAQALCDKIIVVTAELRLSVSRVILRDGVPKTVAYRRLKAQLPEQDLCAAADYVIANNERQDALLRRADAVLAQLIVNAPATKR